MQGPRPGLALGESGEVEVCRTGPRDSAGCGFVKGRVQVGGGTGLFGAEWNEDFMRWWAEGERVVQRGSWTEQTSKGAVDVGGPESPWQPDPHLVTYGQGIAPLEPPYSPVDGVGLTPPGRWSSGEMVCLKEPRTPTRKGLKGAQGSDRDSQ